MATKKISELEAINAAEDNDVLVIVDTSESTTNKITKGNLLIGAGHTIEMTLNENYQIVLVLKNAAGTALSTQTIDLPNENAITNLAYNNGILTVTKQSGATSQINLTGLIEGLVTESDFNTFKEALQATLEAINEKDAEQDEAIAENYKVINKLNEKLENQQKVINQLPQVTGQGTSITLENTIEAQFTIFDVEGNSVQDGTPSPDNEVPIYSAGDNENLFDKDNEEQLLQNLTPDNNGLIVSAQTSTTSPNYIRTIIIPCKSDANYVITRFLGGKTFFIYESDEYPTLNKQTTLLKRNNDAGKVSEIIKTSATAKYLLVKIYNTFASEYYSYDELMSSIKIEKGNKATPYSPYGMGSINEKIKNADGTEEQDYSIFVQQPMMDDDHFDRKNNKEVHTWIKYVLDGSDGENWSIRNNKFFINDNVNYNLWEKSISPNGKSNIGVISYSVLDNQTGFGLALAYGLRLNLENIDASNGGTIEQLRAYLAEHPITIYVKLKDSAYEKLPCTETQIQQLENLPSTYKDFTIIQSEDETPAYLEVSGIRDIDTMFDKVTNAIVSLGGNV